MAAGLGVVWVSGFRSCAVAAGGWAGGFGVRGWVVWVAAVVGWCLTVRVSFLGLV